MGSATNGVPMKDFLSSNDVLFLVLAIVQVIDICTGIGKVGSKREFSVAKMKVGLLKKIADWIYIAVAFVVSCILTRLGSVLEINFTLSRILGWVMLASVLYKETRSIADNLSALGIPIPMVLQKALVLAEKEFDGELTLPSDESTMSLKLNKSLPELDGKDTITVKVRK